MTPAPNARLAAAHRLVDEAVEGTAGVWSRAAALLARQALEQAVTARLARRHAIAPDTAYGVQLHALLAVAPADTARRAAYAWATLSRATHHAAYELPPTQTALRGWLRLVGEVIDALDPPAGADGG